MILEKEKKKKRRKALKNKNNIFVRIDLVEEGRGRKGSVRRE